MALAVTVRFDFVDDKGATSFTKVRVPNGFSVAQYTEFVQAVGQTFANISGCQLTNASITVGVDLSTSIIKAAATAAADIAQKAFVQFGTALAGFRAKLKLPGFDENKVQAGSDNVDQADVDVAAFIGAMENGIAVTGPATISPSDDRENDITTTTVMREQFRRK